MVARLLAAGRVALGLALFVAPARAARGWLGRDAERAGTKVAVRGIGARDVALGVGTLAALESVGSPQRWVEAGMIADLADTAATWSLRDVRPPGRLASVTALALGSAAIGAWLRSQLDA